MPLDDLLFTTRQYINPEVSRSGIARLLKREGMSRLEDVIPKAEGRPYRVPDSPESFFRLLDAFLQSNVIPVA